MRVLLICLFLVGCLKTEDHKKGSSPVVDCKNNPQSVWCNGEKSNRGY